MRGVAGYEAVHTIHGVGRILAGVFVAELGDVTRFAGAPQLCSWAGLTPRHHESDTTVRRGHITKQGSPLVRWAAVEAVARQRGPTKIMADFHRIAERRGRPIARVAGARRSSRSSTTGCATGTSAACPHRLRRWRESTWFSARRTLGPWLPHPVAWPDT